MLTGKLPFFELKNDGQVVMAIISGELPKKPSEEIGTEIEVLWDICERCWTVNPEERPTMASVLRRLNVNKGVKVIWGTILTTICDRDASLGCQG